MRRIETLSILLAGALCPLTGFGAALTELDKVAATGDPAPGTGGAGFALGTPQIPAVNASADVVIIGGVTGATGIWGGSPLALAAISGADAPGTTGAQFDSFLGYAMADNGDILFQANLKGPQIGSTNSYGYWAGPPGNSRLVVRTGQPASAAGAGVVFSLLLGLPQINHHGFAVWWAQLSGPGVTGNNALSLWLGRPGESHLVARQGDPATGFDPGIQLNLPATGEPSLNHSNQVAFLSSTTQSGTFGPTWGIWVGSTQSLDLLVSTENPVPGIPGADFLSFANPTLNDAGQVAFVGSWFNLGEGNSGVGAWMGGLGQVELVVKSGDRMPGTDLGLLAINGALPGRTGNIGLSVTTTNGAGAFFNGLWAGSPNALQLVALEGAPAPELDPEITLSVLEPAFQFLGNDQILFSANLAGPGVTAANNVGLWSGPASHPRLLMRTGDTVEVRPGVIGTISAISGFFTASRPGAASLNAQGDVAVWLRFTNSTLNGVFLARAPANAALALTRVDEDLELSWTGNGFSLEQAPSVVGPWSVSTNQTNPQSIASQDAQTLFFRLSR